jgi:RHS repeat-associated protein
MDLSGSMQGAGGVGGLLAFINHNSSFIISHYPLYDGNGNITEYIDANATVVAHYEYDPFGNTTVASEAKANDFPYRFSTKPRDTISGLCYYGYRWYDPLTGRWPSRDPIQEMGGLNLYGFVSNGGINSVDVLGAIKKGDNWEVKLGKEKCGDMVVEKYEANSQLTTNAQKSIIGQIEIDVAFYPAAAAQIGKTLKYCCCKDGDYRYINYITK